MELKPGKLVVTTSWDDGYPADAKVADLLAKYGVAGTFYIPNRNSEGRPVLSEDEVRRLSAKFEVGGHSIDHVVLTELAEDEATRQVTHNKQWLENLTGRSVPGFCYVRGRYSPQLKAIVKRAGFEYARTVVNLCPTAGRDPFEMPTTIQFYPHRKSVYLKGFVRGGPDVTRASLLWASLATGDIEDRVERLIGHCERAGGTFHLWGHSWEIEELNLWGTLEAILRRLSARADSTTFATNYEAHCAAMRRAPT
jgi:peptidoglycan/xylan/chitin deacetylase (PgdA/CDA1 family)